MKPFIALVVLIAILSGCITPERATGYLKKKRLLDDVCAVEFPVRVTGYDSAEYEASLEELDSLIATFEDLTGEAPAEPVKPPPGVEVPCEDEVEGLYLQAVRREKLILALTGQNTALKQAGTRLKPVIEYRVDSAAAAGLHDRIRELDVRGGKLVGLLEAVTSDRDTYKAKAVRRFWVLIGLGVAGLLIVILFIYRKIKGK